MAQIVNGLQTPYVQLSIETSEEDVVTLTDLEVFLHNLSRLFAICRFTFDAPYIKLFDVNEMYRQYRLSPEDGLLLVSIRRESPMVLVSAVSILGVGFGGVWAFFQFLNGLQRRPLELRKLAAEVEKLERENYEARRAARLDNEAIRQQATRRQTIKSINSTIKRLEKSPFQIESVELEVIEEHSQVN